MTPMYRVEVTAKDGIALFVRDCGSLEIARRCVTTCREEYPDAQWITVNRRKGGRVTAMISMTVFNGTTAQERRNAASASVVGIPTDHIALSNGKSVWKDPNGCA